MYCVTGRRGYQFEHTAHFEALRQLYPKAADWILAKRKQTNRKVVGYLRTRQRALWLDLLTPQIAKVCPVIPFGDGDGILLPQPDGTAACFAAEKLTHAVFGISSHYTLTQTV